MADSEDKVKDQSHPPLPIPYPVPTTILTARNPSGFCPPSATPKNGSTVIKIVICFLLSASAARAAPSSGGLEQRTNSTKPPQGLTRPIPTTLHWQKLNLCLITDSWCIDTHSGFLLSCLAVLGIAFLFEFARWTSRWYDRGLVARLHHLKTLRVRSQSPHARPTTSESEETIRPNHRLDGGTTYNPENAANATTSNGTSPQDDVFRAYGHVPASPSSSTQLCDSPMMPKFTTPGRAYFKSLSAGRERVEGTGIILGGRPDRTMPSTSSARSASTSSQSTIQQSKERRSTLVAIENRPPPPEPVVDDSQEPTRSRKKKRRGPARDARVTAGPPPSPNSPETPLLGSTSHGGGYTSFNDVAAAVEPSVNGNVLNDDQSTEGSNDPPQIIPGIDKIGDLRILYQGLKRIPTLVSHTFHNAIKCVPKSNPFSIIGGDRTEEGSSLAAWCAVCRALLSAVQVSLALALGLVVTTFSGWYLGCIVLGFFAGNLVLGWDELGCCVVVVRDCGKGDASVEGVNGRGYVNSLREWRGRWKMSDEERRMFVPLLGVRNGV